MSSSLVPIKKIPFSEIKSLYFLATGSGAILDLDQDKPVRVTFPRHCITYFYDSMRSVPVAYLIAKNVSVYNSPDSLDLRMG